MDNSCQKESCKCTCETCQCCVRRVLDGGQDISTRRPPLAFHTGPSSKNAEKNQNKNTTKDKDTSNSGKEIPHASPAMINTGSTSTKNVNPDATGKGVATGAGLNDSRNTSNTVEGNQDAGPSSKNVENNQNKNSTKDKDTINSRKEKDATPTMINTGDFSTEIVNSHATGKQGATGAGLHDPQNTSNTVEVNPEVTAAMIDTGNTGNNDGNTGNSGKGNEDALPAMINTGGTSTENVNTDATGKQGATDTGLHDPQNTSNTVEVNPEVTAAMIDTGNTGNNDDDIGNSGKGNQDSTPAMINTGKTSTDNVNLDATGAKSNTQQVNKDSDKIINEDRDEEEANEVAERVEKETNIAGKVKRPASHADERSKRSKKGPTQKDVSGKGKRPANHADERSNRSKKGRTQKDVAVDQVAQDAGAQGNAGAGAQGDDVTATATNTENVIPAATEVNRNSPQVSDDVDLTAPLCFDYGIDEQSSDATNDNSVEEATNVTSTRKRSGRHAEKNLTATRRSERSRGRCQKDAVGDEVAQEADAQDNEVSVAQGAGNQATEGRRPRQRRVRGRLLVKFYYNKPPPYIYVVGSSKPIPEYET